MEPGDIGIRIKVGGLSEDPEEVKIIGRLWAGPYAERIRSWLDTCSRNSPGKDPVELMLEALVLGLAQMTANFQVIEKQESLNAARIEELAKQGEEIQALGDRSYGTRVTKVADVGK